MPASDTLRQAQNLQRILEYHTSQATTPGSGRIQAVRQANDDWRIAVDDHESYLAPKGG